MSDGPDDRELADRLYRELEATEDLPIDRVANRWLGEAQAVASEIRGDVTPTVRREGATDVLELLEAIEGTDNERADERVERARRLAARLAQA
ncbi:hypothetical protein [Halalkalicoccus jeotgali]|uniref:DUF8152 domain-containing protein n=1 Tax=Halalkalicoccus jeotgali (strain DSM 18796 / CECT 7217 / JCM 14584 / KCTC 4019 / B3) TaxID=795797 RepID=D8J5H9_HALJB|nr:hypothetical protein [Halalkalicoccus jeotgali]ADJ15675.1 hypothetical protein HacjB3_11460 [Halalkalicoccus jeotgali B3]ELY36555.1 hypothetical protein C497_11188 [Halalkalicoccus jeotgali B3]